MKKIVMFAMAAAFALSCTDKDFETDLPADKPVVDIPTATGLVLNEVSGGEKFIEIYNTSDKEASLEGVTIVKYDGAKEGGKTVTWTGVAGMKVAAKSWFYVESSDLADEIEGGDPEYAYQSPDHVFTGGLSGKKNLKIDLCAADGSVLDTFERGEEGAGWNSVGGYTNNKKNSFSRVPDGTGAWVYAAPTKGTANGEKTGDIEMVPGA